MDTKKKEKITNGIIYAVLGLALLTIICVAAVTGANSQKKSSLPEDSLISSLPASESLPQSGASLQSESSAASSAASSAEGSEFSEEEPGESGSTAGEITDAPGEEVSAVPVSFAQPVKGYVSKEFSIDTPVYSLTMNDYRTHNGIDVHAQTGSEVYAFADGTVESIYTDYFMGVVLTVAHGGGMKSLYMNLSPELASGITEGAAVTCGQVIGGVGESAAAEMSDSPHLHFAVKLNEQYVNPLDYVAYEKLPLDTADYYE